MVNIDGFYALRLMLRCDNLNDFYLYIVFFFNIFIHSILPNVNRALGGMWMLQMYFSFIEKLVLRSLLVSSIWYEVIVIFKNQTLTLVC